MIHTETIQDLRDAVSSNDEPLAATEPVDLIETADRAAVTRVRPRAPIVRR